MQSKTMNIKINKQISTHEIGDTVIIKVDVDGVPLDRYWRDRLKDSEVDGCITAQIKTENKQISKYETKKIK